MAGIGIDIGSTATKAVVADPSGAIAFKLVIPTGFSSVEVAEQVRRAFSCEGFEMDEMPVVATGYGRVAVPYANKVVTEITCHARGAAAGQPTVISNMCTVFAESEVISLVGKGEPRENIARGVIDSVVARVCTLVGQVPAARYHLTGGLCENDYVRARLEAELGAPVGSCPDARFAGGVGRGHHRRRDGRRSVAFRAIVGVVVRRWAARLSPCGLTCALRGHARRLHLCAGRSYDAGENR